MGSFGWNGELLPYCRVEVEIELPGTADPEAGVEDPSNRSLQRHKWAVTGHARSNGGFHDEF